MRKSPNLKIEKYRVTSGSYGSTPADGNNGAFYVPVPHGVSDLRVIASDGDGWDHVSVSLPHRDPTWSEMDLVKRLFFRNDEVVIQYHVPRADHVNYHEHCLHLWRPQNLEVPRPPSLMVGPKSTAEEIERQLVELADNLRSAGGPEPVIAEKLAIWRENLGNLAKAMA
jgi:hypothetical protein